MILAGGYGLIVGRVVVLEAVTMKPIAVHDICLDDMRKEQTVAVAAEVAHDALRQLHRIAQVIRGMHSLAALVFHNGIINEE